MEEKAGLMAGKFWKAQAIGRLGGLMEAWCWGLAIILTCVGALHCWSARVLGEVIFYRDATLILILALLCVGLGWMGVW